MMFYSGIAHHLLLSVLSLLHNPSSHKSGLLPLLEGLHPKLTYLSQAVYHT